MTRTETKRRTTLADVAREAGVSTALVSLIMRGAPGASQANRDRVFKIAEELGYVPDSRARALRQGRSYLLGVLFDVRQPFHADFVEGLYASAEAAGYDVVLSAITAQRSYHNAMQTLLADRCEALVLIPPPPEGTAMKPAPTGQPVVALGQHSYSSEVPSVVTDDDQGMRLAISHLTELGHNRIVHIDGGSAPSTKERRAAYEQAMRERGLEPVIIAGGDTEEAGAEATAQLVARLLTGRLLTPEEEALVPTAILAYNDACAMGVLSELHSSQIAVPRDVSVVGFDDYHLANFSHIGLTTVRQDARELAAKAIASAITQIDQQGQGKDQNGDRQLQLGESDVTVVTPSLVVRTTTAPVRARR